MGKIDVTELLMDPDFMDSISVIHRIPNVDAFGQSQLAEKGFQSIGCVQPISGKTLQRLPEAYRVADVKSFWIKGKLVSDGRCQYPDIISFKGERYAVQTILDWSNWGEGWSEGTCVRERPTS